MTFKNLSFFSKFSFVLTAFLVGGTLYLWFGGKELFTENREKAEATSPDHTPGSVGHTRRIYGFGYIGYHGGK